ncbi:TPA: hypothetical protein K4M41_004638 [Vibrio parahaemolyticus]|nr:hypothetical protein [Vibrio parahaemolyticus]
MQITVPMYVKGRSFIMAGGLVNAYGGDRFVYFHLLCQGIECIAKAVLLNQDYELYEPKLKDKFGHDLTKLYCEVDFGEDTKSLKVGQLYREVLACLTALNELFTSNT